MNKHPETSASSKGATARRRFLKEMAGAAGGPACFRSASAFMAAKPAHGRPLRCDRPARSRKATFAACVRCGLCVRDCPFDTLKLSRLGDNVATGTPYFEARSIACEMCDDIPCVKASARPARSIASSPTSARPAWGSRC